MKDGMKDTGDWNRVARENDGLFPKMTLGVPTLAFTVSLTVRKARNMSLAEYQRLAEEITAAAPGAKDDGADASADAGADLAVCDIERLEQTLRYLRTLRPPSRDVLRVTKLGRTVGRLAKSPLPQRVSAEAAAIVAEWKSAIGPPQPATLSRASSAASVRPLRFARCRLCRSLRHRRSMRRIAICPSAAGDLTLSISIACKCCPLTL
jgi:hypothetical protein